uniref:thiol-disulfide oxidoreductase DCC family protein n=1 Tax=uncultured Erythrobacter sp. TaxID=263913 RepID=UPI00263042CF|nr:DCC1-like thiol-disulfide oxidoreductase family protein [uncultured Erythrobacter sp.]
MDPKPYSYRDDPAVPDFDDSRAVFVFDDVCVLCSGGVSFIMKHDKAGKIAFASAQQQPGAAICDHYGVDWDDSFILLSGGKAFIRTDGYFEVARLLGGVFRLGLIFQIVPRPIRDWFYDLVARNRYRWFGKAEVSCQMLTQEQRERLL